ncbi:cytochrome ubiquinol oxidase subunit I [Microlunatus aurantiacus]|uniref:Cytochrome ubiquinol oxidase subunit I n=1 Tax=Microlunatus aurantiacus TaxID=446786 RepID=A0ABP7EIY3_9ACTN
MDTVSLARWQFAITTVYHFFFVPVTISMATLVAGFQTAWVITDKEKYLKLTKFFGKLFLINFAMGVVTGIVQEFQFGMNWSAYSRFVGDIFGAPLALEGLLAFFLESTFLGLWIFGWDRLGKKLHLATIWLAAIGTILSAYFILAANSFMQNPVGFTFNEARGRAELIDFAAVLTNPVVLVTFPHQIAGCFMVGGAFVAGVAGWHIHKIDKAERAALDAREPFEGPAYAAAAQGRTTVVAADRGAFKTAVKVGAIVLILAGAGTAISGDLQSKVMFEVQPMKMAAAEALYETQQPAGFSVITIGTPDGERELWSVNVPGLLSFLATGSFDGKVTGINELQQQYTEQFGPGTYYPFVPLTYWSFRWMIGLGMAGIAVGTLLLICLRGDRRLTSFWWPTLLIALPLLPLFANSFGWIFTETGRQPWVVFTLLQTSAGVSPTVSPAMILTSMITFTALYGVLAVVEVKLLLKYLRLGLPDVSPPDKTDSDEDAPLVFSY